MYGVPINQIPKPLRKCFIPRAGYVMVGADYKAGESHIVAYLSGDPKYIEAHESGYDPHTYVCRLTRPELAWTGDPKADKQLAEATKGARGHNIRHLAKSTQHGSNLGGKPRTLAMQAGVPEIDMDRAQREYFDTFPRIPQWQEWVRNTLRERQSITLPILTKYDMDLTRVFHNRPWSDSTYREALAFMPQGILAIYTHMALIDCFKTLEGPGCHALIHNHDQLVFEVKDEGLAKHIKECMEHEIEVMDFTGEWRKLRIPVDLSIGYNWKEVS